MSHTEANQARERLADAIHFSRKGGGYWYPDLLVDSDALTLLKIERKATKDANEILTQINGQATVCFIENEHAGNIGK